MPAVRLRGILIPGILALLTGAASALAESAPPALSFPVDCDIGRTCALQKYVDHDAGEGYRDYRCGPLASDRHDGTDIRLNDIHAMERGVAVIAAADGIVVDTREGMPDVNVKLVGENAVTDRGLGNRVVIHHGDRWLTVYAHLRRDSVAVKKGDRVRKGQVLGQIGLSGLSEFPHLHFSVRHGPSVVDPFTGEAPHAGCDAGAAPLWTPETLARLAYVPSFIMGSGFATRPMASIALQYGLYDQDVLPRQHGRLYYGVFAAGLYPGDSYRFSLRDERGHILADSAGEVSRLRGVEFFVLPHETQSPLPPGRYDARFTLTRMQNGQQSTILEAARSVLLR